MLCTADESILFIYATNIKIKISKKLPKPTPMRLTPCFDRCCYLTSPPPLPNIYTHTHAVYIVYNMYLHKGNYGEPLKLIQSKKCQRNIIFQPYSKTVITNTWNFITPMGNSTLSMIITLRWWLLSLNNIPFIFWTTVNSG